MQSGVLRRGRPADERKKRREEELSAMKQKEEAAKLDAEVRRRRCIVVRAPALMAVLQRLAQQEREALKKSRDAAKKRVKDAKKALRGALGTSLALQNVEEVIAGSKYAVSLVPFCQRAYRRPQWRRLGRRCGSIEGARRRCRGHALPAADCQAGGCGQARCSFRVAF